jgi:hypothetical protein
MGIDGTKKSFSKDVLRVELSGPTQPHLTLVDLPGRYHAGDEHQSSNEAKIIHSLVKSYVGKKRTIILAVVSAMNDFNNQIVTEYARSADPGGDRTLGNITKPDTLHSGSNTLKAFQSLVMDQKNRLKLAGMSSAIVTTMQGILQTKRGTKRRKYSFKTMTGHELRNIDWES